VALRRGAARAAGERGAAHRDAARVPLHAAGGGGGRHGLPGPENCQRDLLHWNF